MTTTRPTKKSSKKSLKRRWSTPLRGKRFWIVVACFAAIGVLILAISRAAQSDLDTLAPIKAASSAGAKLPIDYQLSSLSGTVRYASPNGSSTSTCTANDPCNLARAIAQTNSANSSVVLFGGIYRGQANIQISGSGKDGLRIVAYPGQIPEIRGSVETPNTSGGGWIAEGNLRYRSYVPRPLQEGGGVRFQDLASLTNLNGDGVGRYADQAWIGNSALKQISDKNALQDGQFFVDQTNKRLYMTANDVGKSGIETSRPGNPTTNTDRDRLFQINAARVTIEGIKITRFSANANDYGAVTVESTATNTTLKNVELSHMPFQAMHFALNDNGLLQNVTISNTGWQTIVANQTDNFIMDSVRITDADPFDEFRSSPASGALKTSRTRGTKVLNSYIANNKSHGLWFDQSNINVVVARNLIRDNSGAGVFFEISDGLTLANNYIAAPSSGTGQPVKLAGSSGLRLVNNTLIGGVDTLGVYIDSRSTPGCPQNKATCNPGAETYDSDRQGRFASSTGTTMDWMPRIDVMVNNIIAYPRTASGSLCGTSQSVGLCIMLSHSTGATTTLDKVIHKADTTRNIPQTIIEGNVYANGSSRIIRDGINNYSDISSWTAALAGTPVQIPGLDAKGKSGNSWLNTDGTPTGDLKNASSQAYVVPTLTGNNSVINQYVPAGTRYYGALATQVPAPTDTTAPNGPANLSTSAASSSQVNLSWVAAVDAESGIKEYVIYRNGSTLKTVPGTTLSYQDSGLAASTTYTYQVKAVNNTNLTSAGSPVVSVKTNAGTVTPPPADTTPPSPPANLSRSLRIDWTAFRYVLDLKWTASQDNTGGTGVKEYQIRRNGQLIGRTGASVTNFSDTTLSADATYSYTLTALDNSGNASLPSAFSTKATCFLIWCSLE